MGTEETDLGDLGIDEGELPNPARAHLRKLEKDATREREARETAERELLGYRRKEAAAKAIAEAGVEGVSPEDFGELPPEQISAELAKAKAAEKAAAADAHLAELAKANGFSDVASFKNALAAIQQKEDAERIALARQAGVVATGGGAPISETPKQEAVRKLHDPEISARIARGDPSISQADVIKWAKEAGLEFGGDAVPGAGFEPLT